MISRLSGALFLPKATMRDGNAKNCGRWAGSVSYPNIERLPVIGRCLGHGVDAGRPRRGSFAPDAPSNDGGQEHSASVTAATANKVTQKSPMLPGVRITTTNSYTVEVAQDVASW